MASPKPLLQPQAIALTPTATTAARDAEFDTLWAAWLARGRVHDQRLRRKLIVSASSLMLGAAVLYELLKR